MTGMKAEGQLGRMIRELRAARSMTLAELAGTCQRSIGYMSQVETGRSEPTVSDIHAISNALGVNVGFFFPEYSGRIDHEKYVVRANRARRLTLRDGISNDLLSPNLSGPVELLKTILGPGCWSGDHYAHRGSEAGYVLEGELCLSIEEEDLVLRAGDSFAFESAKPHCFGNPGTVPTVVLWVLTPPTLR